MIRAYHQTETILEIKRVKTGVKKARDLYLLLKNPTWLIDLSKSHVMGNSKICCQMIFVTRMLTHKWHCKKEVKIKKMLKKQNC